MSEGLKELTTNQLIIQKENKRAFFLDNLKVALTCLVIANHGSQAYTSINTGWVIQQGNIPEINDQIIGLFLSINNTFFMALFFLISAYFIPASYERKTISKYLKERFIRLGIPTIFFVLIVFPIFGIIMNNGKMSATDFLLNKFFNLSSGELSLGHTWYLFDLLLFSCTYALYTYLSKNKTSKRNLSNVPGNLKIAVFISILTLVLFVVRIFFPPGYFTMFHIFEPARIPSYIAMFVIGLIAYKNNWIERITVSTAYIWGAISLVTIFLTPIIQTFVLNGKDMWAKGLTLNSFIVSAWDAILCVGLCISLIVLFREKFNFQSKILKRAANDSFAVYLLHPFVLILIQGLMINVALHPFIKCIVVIVISTILCYIICHIVKKLPYVSKVL